MDGNDERPAGSLTDQSGTAGADGAGAGSGSGFGVQAGTGSGSGFGSRAASPLSAHVLESSVGTLELGPPSFLDRWGVVFLACFGFWIIIAGTILLVYGLRSLPKDPVLTGLTADQMQNALNAHKLLTDQWRDSLTSIFDLLITKTALPLVTLLLGYLFGRGRAGTPQ